MNEYIRRIGAFFIRLFRCVINSVVHIPGDLSIIFRNLFSKKKLFRDVFVHEVYHSGIKSIPIVITVAVVLSVIFTNMIPVHVNGVDFGWETLYGSFFYMVMIRSLAPLLTSVLVAVRSSIYITIQLTQMKIGGEVLTLEILGINPIMYLGTMRILAGVLIIPFLTVYFIVFSVLAGSCALLIFRTDITVCQFVMDLFTYVTFKDLAVYFMKTVISGWMIYGLSVLNGLSIKAEKNKIISRTVNSITQSVLAVVIFHFIISMVCYGNS